MATSYEPPEQDPKPWTRRFLPQDALNATELRTVYVSVLGNLASVVVVATAVLVAQETSVLGSLLVLAAALAWGTALNSPPIAAWFRRGRKNRQETRTELLWGCRIFVLIAVLSFVGRAVGIGK